MHLHCHKTTCTVTWVSQYLYSIPCTFDSCFLFLTDFFFLFELTEPYISVLVFTLISLVVVSRSYHTKYSYLSINIYKALRHLYRRVPTVGSDSWKKSMQAERKGSRLKLLDMYLSVQRHIENSWDPIFFLSQILLTSGILVS